MKKHKGENMRKTLQELTAELQTIAHNGHAQDCVYIKILDGIYKIKDIKKIVAGNETYFVIDTEVRG